MGPARRRCITRPTLDPVELLAGSSIQRVETTTNRGAVEDGDSPCMSKIPKNMSFRICVYPSPDRKSQFVAHCLDLDVIGTGDSVQDALDLLLEMIEVQIESCDEHGAQLLFPAPAGIWRKYLAAQKAGRYLARELVERVFADANKRFGHRPPLLDNVMATSDIPLEYLSLA